MKKKLVSDYNYKNKAGSEVEIIDMKYGDQFLGGVGVLVKLNGRKQPVWMTTAWFLEEINPYTQAEKGKSK